MLIVACSDHGWSWRGLRAIESKAAVLWFQNVGNVVDGPAARGSIEYAVGLRMARDVVICGHVNCGARRRFLAKESAGADRLVRSMGPVGSLLDEHYGHLRSTQLVAQAAAGESALVQVETLVEHACIRRGLGEWDLRIHAWLHDEEGDQMYAYQPETGQFEPLAWSPSDPSG